MEIVDEDQGMRGSEENGFKLDLVESDMVINEPIVETDKSDFDIMK